MSELGSRDKAVRARSGRAFTLIEILVVVAIIALLVAVLMPALSAAKRRARMVVCGTNLRTIGQATYFYAQASKDELPAGYRVNPKTGKPDKDAKGNTFISMESFEFLYPFVQKVGVKRGTLSNGTVGQKLPLDSYYCPEDRKQHHTESKLVNGEPVELYLSYGANTSTLYAKLGDMIGGARKLASIKNASSVVIYCDAADDQRNGATGWVLADCMADWNQPQCFFELRHQTGNQFLYIDGHVGFSQAAHMDKPKIKNDSENYGLPPYPSAFIPNWGPKSPNYSTLDDDGHAAPVKTAQACGIGC